MLVSASSHLYRTILRWPEYPRVSMPTIAPANTEQLMAVRAHSGTLEYIILNISTKGVIDEKLYWPTKLLTPDTTDCSVNVVANGIVTPPGSTVDPLMCRAVLDHTPCD